MYNFMGAETGILELLQRSLAVLHAGGIVCLETDTVPGLAVLAENKEAIKKLYALKQRPKEKKMVWMVKSVACMREMVYVPSYAEALMASHWPGPLTLIFKRKDTGESQGFRFADDSFIEKLVSKLRQPLAISSANRSGTKDLLEAKEIQSSFGKEVGFYAWRGRPMSGLASTVIDMRSANMEIIREGSFCDCISLSKQRASVNARKE